MRLYSLISLVALTATLLAPVAMAKSNDNPVMTDSRGRSIPLVRVKSSKHKPTGEKAKSVAWNYNRNVVRKREAAKDAPLVEMVPGGAVKLEKKN